MYKTQNEKDQSKRRLIQTVLIVAILIIVGVWAFRATLISNAEESTNIQEMKDLLARYDGSFLAKADGWAEKKAMERVLTQYNKEHGYKKAEERYTIYHLIDNNYWVTSENMSYMEFAMQAGDLYMCLGDMLAGIRKEKGIFHFCYMDEEQKAELQYIIATLALAQEECDIKIQHEHGEEITIVQISVELKASSKGVVYTTPTFLISAII